MRTGKFKRFDIESPTQVLERVSEGFRSFKPGQPTLLYAHSGILQILLYTLNIYDLFLQNCGSVAVVVNPQGLPEKLIGYWNHGY